MPMWSEGAPARALMKTPVMLEAATTARMRGGEAARASVKSSKRGVRAVLWLNLAEKSTIRMLMKRERLLKMAPVPGGSVAHRW